MLFEILMLFEIEESCMFSPSTDRERNGAPWIFLRI